MNIYDLSLFNKDTKLTFIYKKSQALAKALYMITEHFRNEEPLKWSIRAKANQILEQSITSSLPTLISTYVEIISLVEIASFAGLISDRNFQVLKRELESIFERIDPEKESFNLVSHFMMAEPVTPQGQTLVKDIPLPKVEPKRQTLMVKGNKSDRKAQILNLLKNKSDLSIRDISQAFKDCSEKTIQRELGEMVEEGALTRTGERRWSKYSLKTL